MSRLSHLDTCSQLLHVQVAIDTLGGMFGINKTFSIVKQKTKQKKLRLQFLREESMRSSTMATPAPDTSPTPAPGEEFTNLSENNLFQDPGYVGLHGLQPFRNNIQASQGEMSKISEVLDEKCYTSLRRIESLLRSTKQCLDAMQSKADERDRKIRFKDEKSFEWRVVAVAIDRLFFFVYLAIIVVLGVVSSAILFPRAFWKLLSSRIIIHLHQYFLVTV